MEAVLIKQCIDNENNQSQDTESLASKYKTAIKEKVEKIQDSDIKTLNSIYTFIKHII